MEVKKKHGKDDDTMHLVTIHGAVLRVVGSGGAEHVRLLKEV